MPNTSEAHATRSLEQLWLDYKHRGDLAARDELVQRHLHLVKYIAGRLVMHLPSSVELDDLLSYGVFGLLDAIDKFDYRRGIKFETYAYTRIKGAILDGLRSVDWVPQSLRKRGRAISAAYGALERRLGRPATDAEVAEELGISVEELQDVLTRLSQATVLSLDDVLGAEEDDAMELRDLVPDPHSPDPLEHSVFQDLRQRLAAALDRLPERERQIIALYYYEGLTVKEIGELFNLSASRISQLHARAILRLRAAMAGPDPS
ncbi:MAG: FliA/WhiG family RNA polymerase sigma factor [Thermaerobacter sp.]|nr:FliA/WhiG family RNA polymerase sigma factor [Bacillota bacterium]REJ37815.1 MAG: FliA/WhiG family RNA polymerase sigma factor [Bacillota bacterium]